MQSTWSQASSTHPIALQVTLHELRQPIGHDSVAVSIGSEAGPAQGTIRTYTSLSSIAHEVGLSRVYGGVVSMW